MTNTELAKLADPQTLKLFYETFAKQEDGMLDALKTPGADIELMKMCFTALADIRAMKMSAALVVVAVQCDLPAVSGLGTALQFYWSAQTPDAKVSAWGDVQTAMQQVLDEVKELSVEAIARSKSRTKEEERNAHDWFWRLVHPW